MPNIEINREKKEELIIKSRRLVFRLFKPAVIVSAELLVVTLAVKTENPAAILPATLAISFLGFLLLRSH